MLRRVVTAFALLAAPLLGGAAAHADAIKIRFGDPGVNTTNIYQYLAVDKGIFKKQGIDLELINFRTGAPSIIPATVSNQIDIGGIGAPILVGISRGMPIKVVGAPPFKGQEFVLVGRPDINTVEDLKGKTIGISAVGGGHDQALKVILDALHIDRSEIKTIAAGNAGNVYVAFESGQLAGAFMSEPTLSKVELEGKGHVLAKAADYYGRYQHSYIFASDRFIKENPEALKRYFIANREAIHYAEEHRDELIAYSQDKLKLDKALLTKIFDDAIPEWDDSQALDVEGMLNAIKILQGVGDIDKDYVPSVEKIADLRFIDRNGQ